MSATPDTNARQHRMAWGSTLAAAATYFGAVFAAGFVLGVLRTLAVAPHSGALLAVLLELPLILAVAWWVCRRVLRRWPAARPVLLGMLAFALLMLAEAALSMLLAGRSLGQHLALYREAPHLLGLAGQLAFAALPWLQARRLPKADA